MSTQPFLQKTLESPKTPRQLGAVVKENVWRCSSTESTYNAQPRTTRGPRDSWTPRQLDSWAHHTQQPLWKQLCATL
jgi:hypothetical protein